MWEMTVIATLPSQTDARYTAQRRKLAQENFDITGAICKG
jgi:hypothetical protein